MVCEASTGSGKTVAFLVPSFARILKKEDRRPFDLLVTIIAPTRELAEQVLISKNIRIKTTNATRSLIDIS